MKKAAALLLALLLLGLVAGCGKQAAETAGDPTQEITTIEITTEETEPETEPETTTEETTTTLPATTTTKAATTTAKPEPQAETTAKPTNGPTTTAAAATTTTTTAAPASPGGLSGHNKEFFDLFKKYITQFKDPSSIRIIEINLVTTNWYNAGNPFYVVRATAANSFGANTQSYFYLTERRIESDVDMSDTLQAIIHRAIDANGPAFDIRAINAAVQEYLAERGYI